MMDFFNTEKTEKSLERQKFAGFQVPPEMTAQERKGQGATDGRQHGCKGEP